MGHHGSAGAALVALSNCRRSTSRAPIWTTSGNSWPPAASPEASTFIWPRPSAGCFPAPIRCPSIGNTVWRTARVDTWPCPPRKASILKRHQAPRRRSQENAKATRPEQSRTSRQRSRRGNCWKRILHAWHTTYRSGLLVTVSTSRPHEQNHSSRCTVKSFSRPAAGFGRVDAFEQHRAGDGPGQR